MERFTLSLDDRLAEQFDAWMAERSYVNRSEAVRDLLRAEIGKAQLQQRIGTQCVACLSYVFNHHERDLAERLTSLQHDHHDLTVSVMHAHLDHEHCLETVILRGPTHDVTRFSDAVRAERGVTGRTGPRLPFRHENITMRMHMIGTGLAVPGACRWEPRE